jgi:hypothetical protein
MSFEAYVAIIVGIFFFLTLTGFIAWRIPKPLKHEYYVARWKKVQQRCPDKSQWAQAIMEADDLLNEALKKKKYKGKGMGERLVDAQKNFTNNDAVWFGHKLRTKLDINPELRLTKDEVQKALFGLRQGLKDIGAL